MTVGWPLKVPKRLYQPESAPVVRSPISLHVSRRCGGGERLDTAILRLAAHVERIEAVDDIERRKAGRGAVERVGIGALAHPRGDTLSRAVAQNQAQVATLDNLSAHKAASIRQAIEARGCELLFLPPYSPDFTPIEQAFSKLKAILRGLGARTREVLEEAVRLAIDAITAADATAWFAHAGYALPAQHT